MSQSSISPGYDSYIGYQTFLDRGSSKRLNPVLALDMIPTWTKGVEMKTLRNLSQSSISPGYGSYLTTSQFLQIEGTVIII